MLPPDLTSTARLHCAEVITSPAMETCDDYYVCVIIIWEGFPIGPFKGQDTHHGVVQGRDVHAKPLALPVVQPQKDLKLEKYSQTNFVTLRI